MAFDMLSFDTKTWSHLIWPHSFFVNILSKGVHYLLRYALAPWTFLLKGLAKNP